jgi:UDP-N-acetyl-2-amino-2-deoxyglucuronate dehydrogenase
MDLYSLPNLLDCGTHTFDQALSFNGETPAKWVLGTVDASQPLNWFDVRSESLATGLVVFANGVRSYIQVGGPDKDMQTGVRVLGAKGFIEVGWDGEFGRAARYDDPAWQPLPEPSSDEQVMSDYVRDTLDCLASGEEPALSHRKALRAEEIIFALYESMRRRARVELPLTVDDNAFVTMFGAGAFGHHASLLEKRAAPGTGKVVQ